MAKTNQEKLKSNHKFLWMILLFGILVRSLCISQPLLEGTSTRQVQTAMIARNFYEQGFSLFYPQVDGFGRNPGYLMQEFYFIPFMAAVAYKVLGKVYEPVLRIISIVFFCLTLVMFYWFCSYFWSSTIGLLAALCFSLSPLTIYLGRAVHPEMAIVFFNLGTLYFFKKFLDLNSFKYGLYATLCFIFSVALKIPNLYLLLPLFFWLYEKYSFSFVKEIKFWILVFLFFIPIGALNYHQYWVRAESPTPHAVVFDIRTLLEYIKTFLLSKDFYKIQWDNLVTYTLTPVGFSLVLGGFFLSFQKNKDVFLYYWWVAVGIFFFLMPAQSLQGYYQIHLIPIAAIWMAQFLYFLSQFHFSRYAVALFGIVVGSMVFRYTFAWYKVPKHFEHVVETGKAISSLVEKDALVVSSIQNGPELVYYGHRKGWMMDIRKDNLLIESLEKKKQEGASYFASASLDEFFSQKEFSQYLFKKYSVLKRTKHFIIFDLRNSHSG